MNDDMQKPDPSEYEFAACWLSSGSQRELLRAVYQWTSGNHPKSRWMGRASHLVVTRPVTREMMSNPALQWGQDVGLAVESVIVDDYMAAVRVSAPASIPVAYPYMVVAHSFDVGDDYLLSLCRRHKGVKPPFSLDLDSILVLGRKGGKVYPSFPGKAQVSLSL